MKQMILDYLCDLANDPDSSVANDDVWPAHEFIYSYFDYDDVYHQIDHLLDSYFAKQ